MGDHDRGERRGYRGGGGGRDRGHNNRKRRYHDDDDDRRQQRRRYEESVPVKVRRMVLTIAESAARRVEDDVQEIAKLVGEHWDEPEIKEDFTDLIVQIIHEQPLKIPFVASIILYVDAIKTEVAAETLEKTAEALQTALNKGLWRDAKLLLRFLGCLQILFEGDGIFATLEELFGRAVDCQTASSEDSLGLELVKIILFTIPYIMSSPAKDQHALATALLEKTDVIASTPHALEALVDPYPTDEDGDNDMQTESTISILQKQLQSESESHWELSCLPRPWKVKREEGVADPLESLSKRPFPTITVPEPVPNGPKAVFAEVYMSVYTENEVETVPFTSDIASSVIRDALVDTINLLHFNRHAVAKFLIDVDCYFAPNTFIKRATPFDKLKEIATDRPTWKPEDVAVDAVFSILFQLPAAEHKLVYYHSVLTEACRVAPAAIAPSLGRAIRFLYRNVETMDLDLQYRFLDWFAHHLSNFGFTWKWTEWIEDVKLPAIHPKRAFIAGALDKEIRLSFAQRIKGTLPEPYQALISEAKEKDTPYFKYSDENEPYSVEGQALAALVRRKAPDTDFEEPLKAVQTKAKEHGVEDPLVSSTDAFVTAICFVGAKSLSHVLSCIERCKGTLLAIGPQSEAARRQIIASVMDYWKENPGVGVNIVDKLLNYTILTPSAVVEWALRDQIRAGHGLAQSWVYEMVNATMGKVTGRVRQIVEARTRAGLSAEQIRLLEETAQKEKGEMVKLFENIKDMLIAVEGGFNDEMVVAEGDGSGDVAKVEGPLLRKWGQRWRRVFERKAAVEEAAVNDALAIPVSPSEVKSEDKMANGDDKDTVMDTAVDADEAL